MAGKLDSSQLRHFQLPCLFTSLIIALTMCITTMTATVWSECAQTVEGECADTYQTKNVCEPANVIVSTVASMLMFLLDCKHLMLTPQQVIHNFKSGYNN